MSDERRAYRDLSLNREELFEEGCRKANDALALVEAKLKSRNEDGAAREAALQHQVDRYAQALLNANKLSRSRDDDILGNAMLLAFAAGAVTVPAIVGLIALIRAIF